MANNRLARAFWGQPLRATLALLTLALTGRAPLVQAQTADLTPSVAASTPSAPSVTVGDIDAIMQDKVLLDALLARAKARAELNQLEANLTPMPAAMPNTAGNATAHPSINLPTTAWRRPTAAGWFAKFVYPNGGFAVAGIGETLPGGLKVVRIDADDVQITDATGKKISVAPARLAGKLPAGNADPEKRTPTLNSSLNARPDFALPPATPGQ